MMPIKDEEMDGRNNNLNSSGSSLPSPGSTNGQRQATSGMSKAELRKSNKPLIEKKRRQRINTCLNELKTLILEAMKKDPARHTKLEKADILEMTVKHLQTIQRQQLSMAVSTDPTVIHKFKSGFIDCADEVNRYVTQMDGLEAGLKQRLANHLNNCVTNIQQLSPFNFSGGLNSATSSLSFGSGTNVQLHSHPSVIPLPQDVNNNGRIQMGGVQLIPSRLPTGELALVMPNSNNLSFFPSATFNPPTSTIDLGGANFPRVSAFNTVARNSNRNISSPPLSPVSSISSCGDDSHQSSDYHHSLAATPPLQIQFNQSIMSAFPTPPSNNNISCRISATSTLAVTTTAATTPPLNLQQPQVSSTTEQQKPTMVSKKPLSVITNTNGSTRPSDIHYVNKKRPYPVDMSDNLLLMHVPKTTSKEPAEKIIKLENGNSMIMSPSSDTTSPINLGHNLDAVNNNNNNNNNDNINNNQNNNNNDMWRPW